MLVTLVVANLVILSGNWQPYRSIKRAHVMPQTEIAVLV